MAAVSGKTGGATSPPEEVRNLCSGPFILRQSAREQTSGMLSYRYILLFCLGGSAELCLQSCSYRLTPGSIAVVDGSRLQECRYAAGTRLLEYRPRMDYFASCDPCGELSALTILPSRVPLDAWAETVAGRIREGAAFGREPSCTIRVQLRELSEGGIPYPFSCGEGCPRWERCPATAGYGDRPFGQAFARTDHRLRSLGGRIMTTAVGVAGIGLWGGLLLYFMIKELIGMWQG